MTKFFHLLNLVFLKTGVKMVEEKTVKKTTLIEVLLVILIVGIIVILVFPPIANSKKRERIKEEVFPTFNLIQQENKNFFKENEYYAFDISQLNITNLNDRKYFKFTLTDSTMVATTTAKLGKAGAKIIYNFSAKSWSVNGEKGVIDRDWLP